MIHYICQGNILETRRDALVSPVNTVGVAGAGLAKKIADRWTYAHKSYVESCRSKSLSVGKVLPVNTWRKRPSDIIFFPTKKNWRHPSKYEYIEEGLVGLMMALRSRGDLKSIAIPALGCGLGGLNFFKVKKMIEDAFGTYRIEVDLYPPQ